MCRMQNGSVFVWGTNENGCLGLGPKTEPHIELSYLPNFESGSSSFDSVPQGDALIETIVRDPTLVENIKLEQASLGWKHSGGVTLNGDLLIWGWGGSVGEATQLLEDGQGSGGQLGHGTDFDAWAPCLINTPEFESRQKFRKVDCGLNHTAAVTETNDESVDACKTEA